MKHFRQSVLKALFLLVMLLTVGQSSYAWDNYYFQDTSDNNVVKLEWNSSTKRYTGVLQGSKKQGYYKVVANTGSTTTTYWTDTSSNWNLNDDGGTVSLKTSGKAVYVKSDNSFIVEVKTSGENEKYDPVEVKFTKLPDLYIVGSIFGDGDDYWTTSKGVNLTNSNGGFDKYVIENKNGKAFKFRTNDSSHEWFGPSSGSDTAITNGLTATNSTSTNGNFTIADNDRYVVEVTAFDGTKISYKIYKEEVNNDNKPDNLYLRIWDSNIANKDGYEMNKTETGYTVKSNKYNGEKLWFRFSVKDNNNWTKTYGRGTNGTNGYELTTSNNSKDLILTEGDNDESLAYTGTNGKTLVFTVDFSGTNPKVTITEEEADVTTTTYTTYKLFNGVSEIATITPNTEYTLSLSNSTRQVHIKAYDSNNNVTTFGPSSASEVDVTSGTAISLSDNSNKIYIPTGKSYKYTFTVSGDNNAPATITFTEEGTQGGGNQGGDNQGYGDYTETTGWYIGGNLKVTNYDENSTITTGWDDGTHYEIKKDSHNNYEPIKIKRKSSSNNYFTFYHKSGDNLLRYGEITNNNTIKGDTEYWAKRNNGTNDETQFHIDSDTEYWLQVLTINDNELQFRITTTKPERPTPPGPTDYYFTGDMNNWYSPKEFGVSNTINNFDSEKENWKFTVIDGDEDDFKSYPEHVQKKVEAGETWYVLDFAKYTRFNGNLSGQFQIVTGKNPDSFWSGEGYCSKYRVQENGDQQVVNGKSNRYSEYKKYSENPIAMTDISSEQASKSLAEKMMQRNTSGDLYSNFHLDCNYVENAKIFFKPGATGTCDMLVQGTPRHYYVFYCFNDNLEQDNVGDTKVQAEIVAGKPNANNYFLPGLRADYYVDKVKKTDDDIMWKYEVSYEVNQNGEIVGAKYDWTDNAQHMNYGGYDLVKVYDRKSNDTSFSANNGVNLTEANKVIKDYGVIKIFEDLSKTNTSGNTNKVNLPDGTLVDFDQIWITKIPNGFENPAGMKYQLFLDEALDNRDKSTVTVSGTTVTSSGAIPQTIANNHIYFFPATSKDGVAVHINDEGMENTEIDGHKYKDLDVKFYYRVYYVDAQYNTNVVVHDENGNHSGKQVYASGDTKQNTVLEKGAALNEGWVEMESHEMHAPHYYSTWTLDEDQIPAKLFGQPITSTSPWHVKWDKPTEGDVYPTSTNEGAWDYDYRHKIDHAFRNGYVQIAMVSRISSKDNVRTKAAPENVDLSNFTYEGFKDADYITFMPNALTTENTTQHYPLRGKDKYIVLDQSNGGNFTAVEDITDDFIFDAEEAEANATPVYYNLQGVRVANPTKGIYIKVTGNKSEKVAF